MKKRLFLIVGGVILILGIILISFLSFQFFRNKDVIVNTLEIIVDDNGNKLNLDKQVPQNDSTTNTIEPYNFTIRNKSDNEAKYQLLIEDFVDDKNETKSILSRKYLKYELSLNNEVIKTDLLSNVKNNIIDTREISSGGSNQYSLKVWVVGNMNDNYWMDKYYSYNIAVNPITK